MSDPFRYKNPSHEVQASSREEAILRTWEFLDTHRKGRRQRPAAEAFRVVRTRDLTHGQWSVTYRRAVRLEDPVG